MKKITKWFALAAGVILLTILDQLTKIWAVNTLKDQNAIVIIKDVLELRYLENRGAAFGIMQGRAIPLFIFTCVLVAVIGYIYLKMPVLRKYVALQSCLIFLLAGAFGNMIDRVINQYVVDFIYFKLIDFPTFNVADCYVTVSVTIIAILYLFYYKEDDFDFLKKKKEQ